MKAIAGILLGAGTILAVITIDKALGISTKIVTAVGVTPK